MSSYPETPWLVCPRPRPEATWRLIGFPYGGGGPQAFRGWPDALPDSVELVAVNLPGRGSRLADPLVSDMDTLVSHLVEALTGAYDKPFAFFGHSVGSLVAYETARRLQELRLPMPLRVFASAHVAPAHSVPDELMHDLPTDELIDVIRRLGLVPAEALENTELLDLIVPPLRADFAISETYAVGDVAPLSSPITALGGTADDLVSPADLDAWADYTDGGFDSVTFEGDHFYTVERLDDVIETITSQVTRDIAGLPLSIMEGPVADYPRDATLHELFRAQAAATPEALALVDGDTHLTFRELDEQTDLLARDLQRRGVVVDSLVGIFMETSPEFVIAYLAALKAGGAYMPVDTAYPPALLEDVLGVADPVVVLTTATFENALPESWRERVLSLSEGWIERLTACDLPELDADGRELPGPDSLAYCVMSSGTTGRPKGMICPHRGAVNSYYWRYHHVPYGDDEREACNVFFVWEVLRPMLQGRPAYVIPDDAIFDPPRLADYLHENRITRVLFTPSLLDQVLSTPGLDLATAFEHLRVVYLNGEVVTTALQQRFSRQFPTIRLLNDYSISEAHDVCTSDLADLDVVLSPKYAPAGMPMDNVRIYFLDEEQRPVPAGFVGEIYVGGDSLARGYLNAPEQTAERFIPDPLRDDGSRLFRTGDSGRILPNGRLEIQGRIAFMIKLRGYSIVPGAVESVIVAFPGIESAVVTTKDDPATGQPEHLVAYVVGDGSRDDDALVAALRPHLKAHLPHFSVPSYIVPIPNLPLASSGKLNRRELPDPTTIRHVAHGGAPLDPPTSRLEHLIAEAWAAVLHVDAVEAGDNFFDLGGHSLSAAAVCARLREQGMQVGVVDVFQFPTVRLLASSLEPRDEALESAQVAPRMHGSGAIAVVGVACRFPGAPDADTFWENIRGGVRSIRELTEEELTERGVAPEIYDDPDYRRIGAIVDGVEQFEPRFWGVSRKEAVLMDPQQRLFLECSWQALENAGYAPRRDGGRTGVFGGVFLPTYLLHYLHGGGLLDPRDPMEAHLTEIGNDKDYVTTRVSHLLDLQGPSINVQTSCSTSLVAVAEACQALAAGQCDTALAGASSLTFPQAGYMYAEGHINSRDGHCRPFDAEASGTILGDGVGVVVLKRLEDAEAAGDTILAVITGHATNNDGAIKAGYSAPSVTGQAQVVAAAQAMAGADPDSFTYLECHGTGTLVGDPIEVRALTQVFRRSTDRRGFCAIGSVKGGIGHSNIAAGMAGLIKTVYALHHRELPPLVDFETPNPHLDLDESPFYINETLRPWEVEDDQLRRAGVSCFGIGGTNSHIVLEEYVAPEGARSADVEATPAAGEEAASGAVPAVGVEGVAAAAQAESVSHSDAGRLPALVRSAERGADDDEGAIPVLFTLSARTPVSLQRARDAFVTALERRPDMDLGDAAYTLHVGRELFEHRLVAVGDDADSLIASLKKGTPGTPAPAGHGTVFMFPGQGSQYPRMAKGLYEQVPEFRRHYDACCAILAEEHDIDLRRVAFAKEAEVGGDHEFVRAYYLQPALFAVEYALARTFMAWGVTPTAVVGHSLGEYVAATIAEVVSLPDALSLVQARAWAMEEAGPGAMLAVKMPLDQARSLVVDEPRVDVAVINSPGDIVISGEFDAIQRIEARLAEQGAAGQRLHTTRAFHSPMMEDAARRVHEQAERVTLNRPTMPILSNLTGDYLTDEQALDPAYWGRHLRQAVRFADNAATLLAQGPQMMLELGPGRTLSGLVTTIAATSAGTDSDDGSLSGPVTTTSAAPRAVDARGQTSMTPPLTVTCMRHPLEQKLTDAEVLLQAVGKAWSAGIDVDWSAFHAGETHKRVPLPSYVFDGERCWPETTAAGALGATPEARADAKLPLDKWFSLPSWRRTMPPAVCARLGCSDDADTPTKWLVLDGSSMREVGEETLSDFVVALLSAHGDTVVRAEALDDDADLPDRLLDLRALGAGTDDPALPTATRDLVHLAQAVTRSGGADPLHMWVVTEGAVQVDDELSQPLQATLLGAALVVAQENPNVTCRVIDVAGAGDRDAAERIASRVVAECTAKDPDEASIVAWRGQNRWVPTYESVSVPTVPEGASRLVPGGTYVITGGLGRIGRVLAKHLAGLGANVGLTSRRPVPTLDPESGNDFATAHAGTFRGEDDGLSIPAEKGTSQDSVEPGVPAAEGDRNVMEFVTRLQAVGSNVVVLQADPAIEGDLDRVFSVARDRFGRIDGVFHAAGLAELTYLPDVTDDLLRREFAPKIRGLLALDRAIGAIAARGEPTPGFVMLFSSIAAVLGGLAMTAYMGANRFMDAFTQADPRRYGVDWVCVNWDDWDFEYSTEQTAAYTASGQDRFAMSPAEGIEVLERVLALRAPVQLLVSTRPLQPRLDEWVRQSLPDKSTVAADSAVETGAPADSDGSPLERQLIGVYQRVLGVNSVAVDDNFFDLGGDSLLAA